MRLIKLSTKDVDFKDEDALETFFGKTIGDRTPPGLFRFRSQIAKDGIEPGETILFSFQNRLRYVTKCKEGVMENPDKSDGGYTHCLVIDLPVREADSPLEELEEKLQNAGFDKSLKGQGWTKIPNSEQAEQIIEGLIARF